jgi:NTE family protein
LLTDVTTSRALVLGGGGLAGIAWELGILVGLADEGVQLLDPDVVIGTSAGSVVGTALASGLPAAPIYDAQLAPDGEDAELGVDIDLMALAGVFGEALSGVSSPLEARARVGAAALAAKTVPEATRRAVIEARLPVREWPDTRLLITAIEVESGEFVVFDKDAGVPLIEAVAASCAVPVVWPPITINGRKYMDGGLRSTTNADLAKGHDRVLVVAPYPPIATALGPALDAEIAELRATGEVVVIAPDDVAQAGFGMNPLDPSTRRPSALAGRDQGRALAAQVADLWTR